MIEFKCNSKNSPEREHKWINHTSSSWSVNGAKPAFFICDYCNQLISAAELMQLEAIQNQTKLVKHQLGFQKWLSLIAVITSFIALATSVLVAIFK